MDGRQGTDDVTGSWWIAASSGDRSAFYRRLREEQARIASLGIDPTARDMARPRLNRKQREHIEEV